MSGGSGSNSMDSDDFSRNDTSALGPEWSQTCNLYGRMQTDGSSYVRWRDPTPAGEYGAASVRCKVCGHVVTISVGETIAHGDPRLCEHLGGPPAGEAR